MDLGTEFVRPAMAWPGYFFSRRKKCGRHYSCACPIICRVPRRKHLMRYVCVHGHFYQPPRENPSLEVIELQDSAYPYHDWNERICAECYAPNAVSRILDNEQRIIKLVNNYGMMSFNFGPTLLSWLEAKAPRVYAALLEADRL